jgi:hypothetical protein
LSASTAAGDDHAIVCGRYRRPPDSNVRRSATAAVADTTAVEATRSTDKDMQDVAGRDRQRGLDFFP